MRFRRGRRAGHAGTGRPGTWEVSTSPPERAARTAAIAVSPGPRVRPMLRERTGQPSGTAKRRKTKCGGTGVEKSESADSTDEVGELAPRGPGGGKRRIGSWTAGRTDGLDTEPTAVSTQVRQLAERRRKRRRAGARFGVAMPWSEEPDARVGHVRICGSRGWETTLGHPARPVHVRPAARGLHDPGAGRGRPRARDPRNAGASRAPRSLPRGVHYGSNESAFGDISYVSPA